MELLIRSKEELTQAAEQLLEYAKKRKVIVFYGEIGAGKTTFIQALCSLLGVSEAVTSPTYSLVNEYAFSDPETQQTQLLYHLDLYRLENIEEALNIGIEEYLDSGRYCLIEWPELIESLLPGDTVRINIEIVDDSTRKILFL